MLALYKSEKFQKEYQEYMRQIEEIALPAVRQRAETLLANLVGEVKFLDRQHEEMFVTNKLPMRLGESKSKLMEIRRDLTKLLKDSKTLNK
jgi:hypothetical protein